MKTINMDIDSIKRQYLTGKSDPETFLKNLYPVLEKSLARNIWIHLATWEELSAQLESLQGKSAEDLPLFGIPFAVKDNIDVAGMPTTAGCPGFVYIPEKSAFVVECLMEAGAIVVGKTNLDQFATGLVGTRTPYGIAVNSLNKDYVPGGSSSGSAVAVADGLVPFALGTDTAGSGRVPAAMNGITGLKPTRGVLSTRGVVPACRSLDCVSIFTESPRDAEIVYAAISTCYDHEDPYSQKRTPQRHSYQKNKEKPVIGVPENHHLKFFEHDNWHSDWNHSLELLRQAGWDVREYDFTPFIQTAELLYGGPWVAERYHACRGILESKPETMHEVTRRIIETGKDFSAVGYFEAEYELMSLRRQASAILGDLDAFLTPTIGRPYLIDEVIADPVQLNSNLGYYTNFMNLLDLCAVSVPAGKGGDGHIPFSVTVFSLAMEDYQILGLSQRIMDVLNKNETSESAATLCNGVDPFLPGIKVAVCGAHLDGLPLNFQLRDRGARLVESTQTRSAYRLYDLQERNIPVRRPGLFRDDENGSAIEVEVWEMPAIHFGDFTARIPPPLGIGKCELESGEWVSSFICEPYALKGALDVTKFGGWRNYLKSLI